MRAVVKWGVVALVTLHGLLHLMGVAKGFGWAEVPALTEPISGREGAAWLLAALLVLAAALAMALDARSWWVLAGAAALGSQAVILTSWADARAGTLMNLVLLLAAAYGFASAGPRSLRADYRQRVAEAPHPASAPDDVVTEQDLTRLPAPVSAYVRQSGAVGRPRVTRFHATMHGRIRGGPDQPWMRFTGEQVNTYGDRPRRLFFMDATRAGVPVDVLHVYDDSGATMRVRAGSVVPVADAAGPELDRAETVTMFNDLCVLAPAALVDAPIVWETLDDHRVRGTFTHGDQTVAAELVFDDEHRLADFVSDDRLRASPDGKSFTPQRWSTPISGYRDLGERRVGTTGEARWHAPAPEGEFAYLELVVDDIDYDGSVGTAEGVSRSARQPAR
jgi:hypothetical protein